MIHSEYYSSKAAAMRHIDETLVSLARAGVDNDTLWRLGRDWKRQVVEALHPIEAQWQSELVGECHQ